MDDQDSAEGRGKSKAAEKPNDVSTTLTTRQWASDAMEDFQKLFAMGDGKDVLPPDLLEFANEQMAKKRGSWPRWLMWGLAVKIAHRWVEQELAKKSVEPVAAAEPESKPTRTSKK